MPLFSPRLVSEWQNGVMRLWASCESITFDEFVPHVGETVDVAFGFSFSYFGPRKVGRIHGGLPLDLSALGDCGLVQVPELGRTAYALTGTLRERTAEQPIRLVESAFKAYVAHKPKHVERELERFVTDGHAECEALGGLHLSGKEWSAEGKVYYQAHILRFQSLCLNAGDAHFGAWIDVRRYGDLSSDPDVIGADVCVAEIELSF